MYKRTDLKNGIRVVTAGLKGRESISLGMWVCVGGRHETHERKGLAHFMEHIVFKGTKNYSCEGIKQSVEGVGGTLNAFTGEEDTCFYAKIPSRYLSQTFDVLGDMLLCPAMKPADVEKERTVIIEEIKMYHDLPQQYVGELLDRLLWPNHPLGENLAGSVETVSSLSRNDLRRFHQTFYSPKNIVITACGNVSHEDIVRLTKRKLGGMEALEVPGFAPVIAHGSSARVSFAHKDIEQMHIALGVLALHDDHPDKYALSVLNTILGGNMSSRLFVELREKRGLAYSIGTAAKTLHDTGVFMVRAGVENRSLIDALALIRIELVKIAEKKVPVGEFTRAQDYLLGQLAIGLEDTLEHMLWIGEGICARNRVRSVPEVIKKIQAVTTDDIRRVAGELFVDAAFQLAIVGSIDDQQKARIRQTWGMTG